MKTESLLFWWWVAFFFLGLPFLPKIPWPWSSNVAFKIFAFGDGKDWKSDREEHGKPWKNHGKIGKNTKSQKPSETANIHSVTPTRSASAGSIPRCREGASSRIGWAQKWGTKWPKTLVMFSANHAVLGNWHPNVEGYYVQGALICPVAQLESHFLKIRTIFPKNFDGKTGKPVSQMSPATSPPPAEQLDLKVLRAAQLLISTAWERYWGCILYCIAWYWFPLVSRLQIWA